MFKDEFNLLVIKSVRVGGATGTRQKIEKINVWQAATNK